MFSYLPYDRVSGQWSGLWFNEGSVDNSLNYCDLHSAFNGVVVLDSAEVSIRNSKIHNSQGYGLVSFTSTLTLENTQFTNALYNCLYVDGGDVTIDNCTLAQYYPFDSSREEALGYASASAPLKLTCSNSIITGYADEQIMKGDSIYSQEVEFIDCLYEATFLTIDTDNFIYDFSTIDDDDVSEDLSDNH